MADSQVKVWAGQLAVGDNVLSMPGLGQAKGIKVTAIVEITANNASSTGRIRVSSGAATPARAFAIGSIYDYLTSTMAEGWGQTITGVVCQAAMSNSTTLTVTTVATVSAWGADSVTINATTGCFVVVVAFGGADCQAEIVDSATGGGAVDNTAGFRPTLAFLTPADSATNNSGTVGPGHFIEGVAYTDVRGVLQNTSVAHELNGSGTAPVSYASCSNDTVRHGNGEGFRVDNITSTGVTLTRLSSPQNCSRLFWLMVNLPGWAVDFSLETAFSDRDTVCTGAYELGQPDAFIVFGGTTKTVDYSETAYLAAGQASVMFGAADGARSGSVSSSTLASGAGGTSTTHGTRGDSSGLCLLTKGNQVCAQFDNPVFTPQGFVLPLAASDNDDNNIVRMLFVMLKKVA
jgi:hypothetical protein